MLVTVGVHSPKFEHEADPDALAAAVERYEIHHPVLDDPELVTWQAYGARAWPTLVVLDPEGYIVAHLSGEGHAQGLGSLVDELVAEHEAKGTLHRGNGPYVAPEAREGDLRFPGKTISLENGNFLVGDSGHHRLVELGNDLSTVVRTIGAGVKGYADGDAQSAQFNELQGLTALPTELAAKVGYDVIVADTVNHRLRSVNLSTGEVGTLAGNGVQRLLDAENARQEHQSADLGTDSLNVSLSSPWDVLYHPSGKVIIAMAGTHQIFSFDPLTSALHVYAGSGLEGLSDGAPLEAWFAQPSGLTLDTNDDVWVADSETSALRRLEIDEHGEAISVHTAIGAGLFDFGFRDGAADQARLQHPLGVTALPDGSIAVADSYNGAVRRFDPVTQMVSTLAKGLKEPADVLLDDSVDGAPVLLVVETNTHQLIRIPVPAEALVVDEGASQTQRPKTKVQAGQHEIVVRFGAPKGQKLDDRWGDPTQLKISASPEELLLDGGGTSIGLTRTLKLNPEVSEGVLHITARAAACDGEPGGEIPDHAACHLYQQDWGIPVELDESGDNELLLDLRGVN